MSDVPFPTCIDCNGKGWKIGIDDEVHCHTCNGQGVIMPTDHSFLTAFIGVMGIAAFWIWLCCHWPWPL